MDMRYQTLTLLKALALCLPLALAGCGGGEPVDPCKKFQQKVKGKDVDNARERAFAIIEKRKKSIAKQYLKPIRFDPPTVTCAMPEKEEPKPKKAKADDPWVKKKKEKPIFAICQVVLPYCVK
jgi:hypothetical protein